MDVVLLGHGSQRGTDTDIGLKEIVNRLQSRLSFRVRVRMAGFEFTQPTLQDAVLGLADEDASSIVVMPFFLFEGKHVRVEIPEQLEQLKPLVPGVPIIYTRPLGVDYRLVQIVKDRVDSALTCRNGEAKPIGIVMVMRGSKPLYDSGDNLYRLVKGVENIYNSSVCVEPAQAQFGFPTIDAAVASLSKSQVEVVIIMPYLLFPGKVLYDNIYPSVERLKSNYPDIQFCMTDTLGVDDRMIEIALDRLRDAGVEC